MTIFQAHAVLIQCSHGNHCTLSECSTAFYVFFSMGNNTLRPEFVTFQTLRVNFLTLKINWNGLPFWQDKQPCRAWDGPHSAITCRWKYISLVGFISLTCILPSESYSKYMSLPSFKPARTLFLSGSCLS